MPLFNSQSLTGLTLKLFQLIDSEGEDHAKLCDILNQSNAAYQSIVTRCKAINFLSCVGIKGSKHNTIFENLTCLDIAILKNKKTYVELLATFIFTSKILSKTTKQIIFSSAICICCAQNRIEALSFLLKFTEFDVNCVNKNWYFQRTNLALNIAVLMSNEQSVSLLLQSGADIHQVDANNCSSEHNLKCIIAIEKRKKISNLLYCKQYILQAKAAYQKGHPTQMYGYLVKAIEADVEQFNLYLAQTSQKAIQQLSDFSDTTNYAFLLEFIRVFACVSTSPLSTAAQLACYKRFQLETALHLLAVYDCEANVPAVIQKIFPDKSAKFNFFLNFGSASILHESGIETIKQMKEKSHLPDIELLTAKLHHITISH